MSLTNKKIEKLNQAFEAYAKTKPHLYGAIEQEAMKPQEPVAWLTEDYSRMAASWWDNARPVLDHAAPQPCPDCLHNKAMAEEHYDLMRKMTNKVVELEGLIGSHGPEGHSFTNGQYISMRIKKQELEAEVERLNKVIAGYERDQEKIIFDQGDQAKTIMQQIERITELRQQNALYQDEVEQLETDFNAQEVRMHEVRKERDALAIQNQQMREALTLWKIASDNSEEVEFDEMAAYSIPMPLFCDADEATEAALVLPDNTEAIIKRHDSAIREEMIDLFRLKHRDYANELAAELEGKS